MKKWKILSLMIFLFAQPAYADGKELANIADRSISLYAQEHGNRYYNFEIHIGKRQIPLPEWTSININNTKPQMHSFDMDHDGTEEIIVMLIKKQGKGVYLTEPKIMRVQPEEERAVEEIFVNDARTVLLQEVKYYRKGRNFHVQLNGKDVLKLKNEANPPKLSVDSFVAYELKDGQLTANILLKNTGGDHLGTFQVIYDFKITTMEPVQLVFNRR